MKKYKRRLIPIVDRKFQFKYTAIIVAVAAVISCILGLLLLSAYREMNAIIEVSSAIGETLDADDARRVFYIVISFLIGEVAILGVLGLLITHRVAGPLFVFHRHLKTMKDGQYPKLRPLRPGDEFGEAFRTLSELIVDMKERDREEANALTKTIAAAEQGTLSQGEIDLLTVMVKARRDRLEDE